MATQSFPITVLLSTYNDSTTLNRCFESLISQTYQDFLIVCVNDTSTDHTQTILESWQKKFGKDRMNIIQNNINQGLTKSLNIGLSHIETDFTARIDADDWWEKTKIEKQISFLQSHPDHGLIGCNYYNIIKGKMKPISCLETDTIIKKHIFKRNPFAHSTVVFHTATVKKLGGYDEQVRYGQDYDLWFRLLPLVKFHNLQEYLCYRNADSGISQSKQNDQMRQCFKTVLKYLKLYQRPFWEYSFLLEPLLVILTPNWIKKLKRALV